MTRTISILGMGPGDLELQTLAVVNTIANADVIVGAKRLLEMLPEGASAERFEATRTQVIVDYLDGTPNGTKAAVLMSGDIGFFSGATRLREALSGRDDYEVRAVPGISSSVLFAAALGRPWQDWKTISAHGVSCDIAAEARHNAELFLVTGGDNTVDVLCRTLVDAGLGNARVSVGERLSYPDQRITVGTAAELANQQFEQLAVMLVEAGEAAAGNAADAAKVWPWSTHGLPDSMFERDKVPMTKQDVRAVALSHLKAAPTDVVYDVGSGSGSVSVELALLCPEGHVYAIERKPLAVELTKKNAEAFGLQNISVVEGFAPEAFAGLPAPDAAFIGGSGSALDEIVQALLDMNPRVRLCVTCVTLETLAQATTVLQGPGLEGFELSCINAANARVAGNYHLLNAENPVFILTAQGSGESA